MAESLPSLQGSPSISLTETSLSPVLKALCRQREPGPLSIPPLSGELTTPPPEARPLVTVLWPLSPSPSTTRTQKTLVSNRGGAWHTVQGAPCRGVHPGSCRSSFSKKLRIRLFPSPAYVSHLKGLSQVSVTMPPPPPLPPGPHSGVQNLTPGNSQPESRIQPGGRAPKHECQDGCVPPSPAPLLHRAPLRGRILEL